MQNTRFGNKEYVEYLNKSRATLFWNKDQLKLILKSVDKNAVHNFLDAGCGLGYLTFMLRGVLNKQCKFLGIDSDPKLIKVAQKKSKQIWFF